MRMSSLLLACALAPAVGACASAPAQDQVAASRNELTLAECATQRDDCFARNPVTGALTCPPQYAECAANADDGRPAQVIAAAGDARKCVETAGTCAASATTAGARAACAETEATCVAAIVGVDLPKVVDGTTACVNGAVDCINAAESPRELAVCGTTLGACARDQAEAGLPPDVTDFVNKVADCGTTRDGCIADADSPASLTACGETAAKCVADTLNVPLPNLPISEVVDCGDKAATCALDATSRADLNDCAATLARCTADAVGTVDVPPALTCAQQWTRCIAGNGGNFLECAGKLAECRDAPPPSAPPATPPTEPPAPPPSAD
jgi:hypothetical protein